MTIPKKGSRKIIVDNIEYRWRVRHKGTYMQDVFESFLTASVELYENPQNALLVEFPWVRFDAYIGDAKQPVTPKLIESCIKTALSQGWKPNEKGKTFQLNYEKQ
jgi:hypothetical protein